MIKVGLTGGIGSGKTYVSNLFQQKDIPIYNSDERGKFLMNNDSQVKLNIIDLFGSQAYNNSGLNREYIAEIVFSDKNKLAKTNSIIHPAVQKDFENWTKKHNSYPYIIKEAAILIESGAYKQLDYIIVVSAPLNIRIERIAKRDNMTLEAINFRMLNQMPDNERLKYANFTIENDGIMLVDKQVDEIHNSLLKE